MGRAGSQPGDILLIIDNNRSLVWYGRCTLLCALTCYHHTIPPNATLVFDMEIVSIA